LKEGFFSQQAEAGAGIFDGDLCERGRDLDDAAAAGCVGCVLEQVGEDAFEEV